MLVTDLYDISRSQTNTTSAQFSDTNLLKYANLVYHDLENAIVNKLDEDFFYNEYTTDLVDWQSTYSEEVASATNKWFKKILRVEIKRDDDDDYRDLLNKNSVKNLWDSQDFISEEYNKLDWFWDYKFWKLFIYPEPDDDVTDWLKLYVIEALKDLNNTNTAETYIFPWHSELRQYHYLISIWIKQYIYKERQLFNESNQAEAEFIRKKQEMLSNLTNKKSSPMVMDLPSSGNFR